MDATYDTWPSIGIIIIIIIINETKTQPFLTNLGIIQILWDSKDRISKMN